MLDGVLKHRAGPTKTVAGTEQAIDLRSVPRPLLDLVEIAQVGDQRIGGLLVEVNVVGLRIGAWPDNRPIGAPLSLHRAIATAPCGWIFPAGAHRDGDCSAQSRSISLSLPPAAGSNPALKLRHSLQVC
jgi:hypothetical protein